LASAGSKASPLVSYLQAVNPTGYTAFGSATVLTAQNLGTIFSASSIASNVMFGFFNANNQSPQATDLNTSTLIGNLGFFVNAPVPVVCQFMILNGTSQNATTTYTPATFTGCDGGAGTCFTVSALTRLTNVTINSTNINTTIPGVTSWSSIFNTVTAASYAIYSTCRLNVTADTIWSNPTVMWLNIPATATPPPASSTAGPAQSAQSTCPAGQGAVPPNNYTCANCTSGVNIAGVNGPPTCSTGKLLSSLILLFVLILSFL